MHGLDVWDVNATILFSPRVADETSSLPELNMVSHARVLPAGPSLRHVQWCRIWISASTWTVCLRKFPTVRMLYGVRVEVGE